MQQQAIVQNGKNTGLISKLAERFSVEPEKMMTTLKATAFKVRDGEITNEQMMALLVVANQYGLNPFTKELFAFPDKGGIVPVVSVDGWARIINEHPAMDGVEFVDGPEENGIPAWIECVIYRKDRAHPTKARERFKEVRRDTQPWKSHPARMMRHKALIQCARIAFGFAGIYEQDEAERIVEMGNAEVVSVVPPGLGPYPDDQFNANIAAWAHLITSGGKTPDSILSTIRTKYTLTAEQENRIKALAKPAAQVDVDKEWMDEYNKEETNENA